MISRITQKNSGAAECHNSCGKIFAWFVVHLRAAALLPFVFSKKYSICRGEHEIRGKERSVKTLRVISTLRIK